jgi:hypothetical protein
MKKSYFSKLMKLHIFLSISLAIPLASTLMLSNTPKTQASWWNSTSESTSGDPPQSPRVVEPSTTVKPPTRVDDSTYYDFQISNSTNKTVSIIVSDKKYTLEPDTKQDFHQPHTQGGREYTVILAWPGSASRRERKYYVMPYPNYDRNYTFTLNNAGETILKSNSGEVIDQSGGRS